MSLKEYRRKRSFTSTPEPRGGQPPAVDAPSAWRFVVQKHAATNLHYDLRLELNGVLKSWAVPKGPSLDPQDKRLAVHVEDHPLEYLLFEGVIPKQEYGGGTVMVWDTGHWHCDDPNDYQRGELKFTLDGNKLQGRWMLVHTGRRRGDAKHWLLFKERDAWARDAKNFDVLAEYPRSALTDRTMEQIAADRDAVWSTADRPAGSTIIERSPSALPSKVRTKKPNVKNKRAQPRSPKAGKKPHPKARRTKLVIPQPALPSSTAKPPAGDKWIHEIKFDGYRMLGVVQKPTVKFISRNGRDWSSKLLQLAKSLGQLPAVQFIVDGEVVFVAADGTTNFQSLQNTIGRGDDRHLRYYVFDLLYLNGYDLTHVPLLDRKQLLAELMQSIQVPQLIYSDHIQGDGELVFQKSATLGAEGIVSKRVISTYPQGRTKEWLKTKCLSSAEFVVGGFVPSSVGRDTLGALCVGRYDSRGKLRYEGRVGTGFSAATQDTLWRELVNREVKHKPFLDAADDERKCRWVKPELVVELEFAGWTNDGRLRFPSYRGLHEDIAAVQVRQENHSASQASTESPTRQLDAEAIAALQQVRWTHADRVLYPETGVTKHGIALYYASIWERMASFVVDRPLAIIRFPGGLGSTSFFQKNAAEGMPPSIGRFILPGAGSKPKPHHAMVVKDLAGLLTLVQFSALEIHAWGARCDRVERPDQIVFDLDPHESLPFTRVIQAAVELREILRELELQCFVKTTGGKGLHIVLPIRRTLLWDDAKQFAFKIASLMAHHSPGRYTTKSSKSARQGKIYIDYLRNGLGATSIATYSTRANSACGIATPVTWDELPMVTKSTMFTIHNINRRMQALNVDPWKEFFHVRQSITKSILKVVS